MKVLYPPAIAQKSMRPKHEPAFGAQRVATEALGGTSSGMKPGQALAQYIDHTQLTATADEAAIRKLCDEARQHQFYAVCIRPQWISQAKRQLQGSGVSVATVIGFPQEKTKLEAERRKATVGDILLKKKELETIQAVRDGVDEIDLVMNVRQFLEEAQYPSKTLREFKAIRALAPKQIMKVIIETDLLTPEQVQKATLTAANAGADFVKTSTGMVEGGVGATVENIALMRETLDQARFKHVELKASGGINTQEQAQALVRAGAMRLGASKGVQIVSGQAAAPGGY